VVLLASEPEAGKLKLKVADAVQDAVNKGIVRIDSNLMYQIGLKPGSIVQIEGERKTVAIVDRAYPSDIGLNIIRMDGIVRRNAKASIGDVVSVTQIKVKEATRITIAPSQANVQIQAPPAVFKNGLLGRTCVKGDIVSLGGTKRRRSTMSDSPFFDDIFNLLDENFSSFGFSDIKFVVVDCIPSKEAIIITENTEVVYSAEAVEIKETEKVPDITYEDIGGLNEELSKVRELVELPLKHPEIFERLGVDAPKGVLMFGPPGTGKTLLARAIANETHSNFSIINGPEIMGKFYGQSEENLRKVFEDAEKNSPAIIFIDEIDAIASKRDDSKGEVERRVVAQLLSLMDGLKSRGKVLVIAATNRPNALDPALRRPGRFDREIEIGVPNKEGREAILKIHTRNMPIKPFIKKEYVEKKIESLTNKISDMELKIKTITNEENKKQMVQNVDDNKKILTDLKILIETLTSDAKDNEEKVKKFIGQKQDNLGSTFTEGMIKEIASITHGFVGADLQSLAKEAAMVVLRRVVPELDLKKDERISDDILSKLTVTRDDFYTALRYVRPSAMREVLIEVPNVKWNDIGGLEEVKRDIGEAVEWPLKYKDAFTRLGIKPPRGILLYGPPGTGKTLLAKAVATESEANFISVKGPELISKWVGESEKGIRDIFAKARQTAPCIVFFDEIDAIVSRRSGNDDNKVTERMVNQFLTEMDGVEEMRDVIIIGATNRPDMIDPALIRTGRFDRVIMTPIPDEKARIDIFRVHTKNMPIDYKSLKDPCEDTSTISKTKKKDSDSKEIFLKYLASRTDGFVGADIEGLCREAAIVSLRKSMSSKEIVASDFEEAIKNIVPSVTEDVAALYEEFKKHFSVARAKQIKDNLPDYFG
jgi:transitional endoplasmic reticulum ATPase